MEFIVYGSEGGALVKGLVQFKYLDRPMEQTYNIWQAIIRNIKIGHKVWV